MSVLLNCCRPADGRRMSWSAPVGSTRSRARRRSSTTGWLAARLTTVFSTSVPDLPGENGTNAQRIGQSDVESLHPGGSSFFEGASQQFYEDASLQTWGALVSLKFVARPRPGRRSIRPLVPKASVFRFESIVNRCSPRTATRRPGSQNAMRDWARRRAARRQTPDPRWSGCRGSTPDESIPLGRQHALTIKAWSAII
jgi:hypothetical protein